MKLNSNCLRPGTPKTRANRAPWIFLMRSRSTRLQSRPASQSLNDLRYRLPSGVKSILRSFAPAQITDARTGQERLVFPGSGERQKVGGQAALRPGSCVCACDLNFGYQRRNSSSSSSLRTVVLVCSKKWAPRSVMELNRYPENYFAEVEQAAFSPANVVPGIGFSPDKMLQGRLFSYGDTQRYRLGVNFNHIPVNAAKCPFLSYHRDGQMRTDGNLGATTNYNPNSQRLWDNQPEYAEPPFALEGDASHYDHRLEDDHWEQPGNLFRKMTSEQKRLLFENTARGITGASLEVLERHVANCRRADPAYGEGVARALRLDVLKAA